MKTPFLRLCAGTVLAFFLALNRVQADAVLYVNQNAPSTSRGDGSSWANAYSDLQSAIAAAHPTANLPVDLWVASGVYYPTTGTNRSASFVMKSYLRIEGGFAGTETNDTQRFLYGHPTVLSGDIGRPEETKYDTENIEFLNTPFDPTDPGAQDNCYNVVYASNVVGAVLDLVYITGGFASVDTNTISEVSVEGMSITTGPTNSDDSTVDTSVIPLDARVAGGGVFLANADGSEPTNFSLALNNVTFKNNGARGYGGGMAVKWAYVESENSQFIDNYAGEEGGGYWGLNTESDFLYGSFATNNSDGVGGGIVYRSIPTDGTVDPYGEQSTDYRHNTELTLGAVITSTKLAPKLYNLGFGAGDLASRFKALLPGNPFEPVSTAGASAADIAGDVLSRIGRGYAWLTIGVTVVDIAADIATWAGAGNSAFVKDWTWFSDNFTEYATPQGWLTSLFELAGLIKSPSPTQLAWQVMQQQEFFYNEDRYSSIRACNFIGNSSDEEGGAYYCSYNNVHVEDCMFQNNLSADGGAVANFVWETPIFISDVFLQNIATEGQSAMINGFHARPQIMNCTFSDNYSATAGYAMGNCMGAEVTICNSIFWGNSNNINNVIAAGADVFTSVHTNLDSSSLSNYTSGLSDGSRGDWIGLCDISWSCVQSLPSLALGSDNYPISFPEGFSDPTEQQLNDYISQWDTTFHTNDLAGLLDTYDYLNTGEGFRTNIFDLSNRNINSDPLLINGYIPSRLSPVIGHANAGRLNNGVIDSFTGVDVSLNARYSGDSLDMGAVQYQGGPDPSQQPGQPGSDAPVQQNIIYVVSGGAGAQNGTNWANATGNLANALQGSLYPVQVWVAAGTYYPTTGTDRTVSFSLGENVQVYGGFSGTETNLGQRNWVLNHTILSGDIGTRGVDSDNSYHVFVNTNNDPLSILDGFTITKGRGDYGSGIENLNAYPQIQNCSFVDNESTQQGGAIYSSGLEGSPITDCTFTSNFAAVAGGAIYYNSRLQLQNGSFIDNSAGQGGALYLTNIDYATIYNSLFVSNSAHATAATGGAIFATNVGLQLFNSTFTLNTVTGNSSSQTAEGAGITFFGTGYNQALTLQNCIFWQNTAAHTGGAIGTTEFQQVNLDTNSISFIQYNLIDGLDTLAGSDYSSNVDVDPLFANPAIGDFQLRAYSPCIDSGDNYAGADLVTNDLAGAPRIVDGTIDLGCYEFQGAADKVAFQLSSLRDCDPEGADYTLQLVGTNALNTVYQWQVNRGDGLGFVTLTNGGVFAGAQSTTLAITHPPVSMNGYQFRVSGTNAALQFTSATETLRVSQTLFYVNAAAHGANNGADWADAYTNLAAALTEAQACSQIWVAGGTYYPSATSNTNDVFRMRSDIAIYGGFNGTETSAAQRDWRANPTVLSGVLPGSTSTNGHSASIVFNYGNQVGLDCGPTAILDGFILTGASSSAMVNLYASPTIRHCVFTTNTSTVGGAMRNNYSASPLVTDCAFINNNSGDGGAVNCGQGANAIFEDCLFVNNQTSFRGGAASIYSSATAFINCTIADNFASVNAGGLYVQGATNELLNTIVWGNTDQEPFPTATSAQVYLDKGVPGSQTVFGMTNTCLQGYTSLVSGNFGFDPLFNAESEGDYHLTSFSPAVNAGSNAFLAGFTFDLDNNPRVNGAAIDLGPYEYQAAAAATPVDIYSGPQPVLACNAVGTAQFSVLGANGSGNDFVWEVNRNDGLGFVQLQNALSNQVVLGTAATSLYVSNLSLTMSGWQYAAAIPSIGFLSPPATLTVELPSVVYVKAGASGANNGSSWSNAYTSLQSALNSAGSCSQIWVAQGTYTPNNGTQYGDFFQLQSQLAIYGGFAGTETNLSQRAWTNHPTIITGGAPLVPLIENNGEYQLIDSTAVLDGFVLLQTNANVPAIDNFLAGPTIRNCVFTGCMYAIDSRSNNPIIVNCIFTNNPGTCLYNQQTAGVISNCVFANNATAYSAGAIYNWESSPVIVDSLFLSNSAGFGGAIFNDSQSQPQFDRCIFRLNSSGLGGAIVNQPTAAPSIKNCLFDENVCGFRGGAIADYGSGMTLANCTLVRNTGEYSGCGLYFQGTAGKVDNCIFWQNVATQNPDSTTVEILQLDNNTGSLVISNSIIQALATYTGHGNMPFDPLFTNVAGGNFELTAFSPAINVGDNSVVSAELLDLAEQPRLVGAAVDLGAYEFQGTPSAPVKILGSPQSQTNCVGTSAEFGVVTQPGDTNVFQWQIKSGTNFFNVTNVAPYQLVLAGTSNSLVVPILSLGLNGTVFRLIDSGGFTSPSFTLGVVPPTIVYVNAAAPPNGDGTTWARAFTNLQDALAEESACVQVWVAKGTYAATVLPDEFASFPLVNGLHLYGGFAGMETNLTQRNWAANPTVLVGYTNEAVFNNDGTEGTISPTTVVNGFTISGQSANINAVANFDASPTFQNCTFIKGSPAMWNTEDSDPVILNCVFSNNFNQAVVNVAAAPIFTNCLFISNNSPFVLGGAMYNSGSTPTIVDCQFLGNNSAAGGAGIAFEYGGGATIRASTFEGNTSGNGTVYSVGVPLTLLDCLIAENESSFDGGGLFLAGTNFTLNNCTIAANTASASGGGLYSQTSVINATNTIFWQNAGGIDGANAEAAQIHLDSGVAKPVVCIIQGLTEYVGSGNVPYSPLFSNAPAGNFAPGPYSSAINAGTNVAVGAGDTDVLGNPRIAQSIVDIGAIEIQNPVAGSPLLVSSFPTPQTTCVNGLASFVVDGSSSVISHLTWQVNEGSGFVAIPNDGFHFVTGTTTSSTLTISNVPSSFSNYQYRIVVSSPSYTSSALALTVLPRHVIYVNVAAHGAGTGADWVDAYTNLGSAVSVADSCSAIWVAQGTYRPQSGQSVSMLQGLEIYGGFAGTETILSQRNWTNHPTFLCSDYSTTFIYNRGDIQPIDRTAILDGFVLTSHGQVIALNNYQAGPTIQNCVFETNNYFAFENAGLSSPLLANCVFTNNSGNAFDSRGGSPVLTNCVFIRNQNDTGGAAVSALGGSPLLLDCSFQGNTSTGPGGAVISDGASVAIVNSIFTGNASPNSVGGALAVLDGGTATATNCLFYGNSGYQAGAIFNEATLFAVNCTIANNSGSSFGGGVVSEFGTSTLLNTILWQNTSAPGNPLESAQLYNYQSAAIAVSNSCIQGLAVYAGNNNLGNDPLFLGAGTGNYQLSPFSPAINVGANAFNSSPVDLAGSSRIQLGVIDLGAYESSARSNTVALLTTPASQSLCAGETADFTVQSGSAQSFVWQYLKGGVWTNFTLTGSTWSGPALGAYQISSNATTSTLEVFGATAVMNGYQFRFLIPGVFNGAPLVLTVAQPTVVYVNAAAAPGGNGTSWASAFNTLSTALTELQGCQNEVWIAAGTYRPVAGTNTSISFQIPPDAEIYGGFAGNETSLSQRNWTSNVVVLSGAIGGGGSPVVHSSAVVAFSGETSSISTNTLLDGVTISGGQIGVSFDTASPTLNHCVIAQNLDYGVIVRDSDPVIENSTFISNSSPYTGAAFFAYHVNAPCTPIVRNSVFTDNTANSGGAVGVQDATPIFEGCLFDNNSAVNGGGAIDGADGSFTLINCTIAQNSTASDGGGGIETGPTLAIIKNSILWGNTSSSGSGEGSQIDLRFGATVAATNNCIENLATLTNNNNIAYDPLFANTATGNFHVESCSPVVGAGNVAFAAGLTTDLDGNPRLVAGKIDLGAYEEQTTGGSPLYLEQQPVSFTYCPSQPNSLSVVAVGAASLQWQVNRNDGLGFVNVTNDSVHSGATAVTLNITSPPYTASPWQYRCLAQNGSCSVYSKVAVMAVQPAQIFVNAAAPTGGNGLSWATAFQTIPQAVASPFTGACQTEIWVAAGNYTAPVTLSSGLKIYGGFAGAETSLGQRNWSNNPTRLITGSQSAVSANGFEQPCNNTALLDGFILAGGSGASSVSLEQASPTIQNCLFVSNSVGALFAQYSQSLISNCQFAYNAATPLLNENSQLTLAGCLFVSNQATAFHNSASAQTAVRASIFAYNAGGAGGAIENDIGCTLGATNCLFLGNSASTGGAIENQGALAVVNCTFDANVGVNEGSGIDNQGGTVAVENTILWNNAQSYTGTLETSQTYSASGSLGLTNCLIQGLSVYAGHGNVGSDPLFLDPGHGNYDLSPYSPAVNAGANAFIAGTTVDLGGNPRVANGIVDIGAYESATAQTPVVNLTSAPVSTSICGSADASFTVVAPSSANFTWQYYNGSAWQTFTLNGGNWSGPSLGAYSIASNSTSSTLTVSSVSAAMNGYQFRFIEAGSSYVGAPLVLTVTASGVIYVNAAALPGGNGQSWSTAFNTLKSALSAVNLATCARDIWVAGGTYYPTPGSDTTARFEIPPGAAIYGGFVPGQTSLSQRNWAAHPTILSGDIGAPGVFGDNSQVVVDVNGAQQTIGPETVLDGLTIVAGHTAGLNILNASPTVQNCVVADNGQGVYLFQSSSAFSNCVISGNTFNYGGGVASYSGSPSFVSCLFSNNTASTSGGGLWVQQGNVTTTNCVFTGNSSPYGGAVGFGDAGTAYAINDTIANNTASGGGAGFQGSLTNLYIVNSILWNNSAAGTADEAAQIYLTFGTASVSHSDIDGLNVYAGNNNLDYDPVFASSGQYELSGCSPLIDAGANAAIGGVTTDISGAPRIVNSSVDIGAYEFQGAAGSPMEVVSQPGSVSFCPGSANAFTFDVTGQNISFQWEINRNDGNGFVPVVNGLNYSGAMTSTLAVSNVTSADDGSLFQCVATSGAGCSVTSQSAALTFSVSRWYVNAAAPSGGDGSSWSNAFQTLDQAFAVTLADCNNEFWVAQGTYYPPSTGYQMYAHLAIYGGFTGSETSISQRNWKTHHTVLDGRGTDPQLIYNQQYYVFTGEAYLRENVDPTARLDGFILQHATGSAVVNWELQYPTFANCVFQANTGSAISNIYSGPTILNCSFFQNGTLANGGGGAIYHYGDSTTPLIVQDSVFQGNVAGTDGGAIWVTYASAYIYNSLFTGNSCGNFGGAIGAAGPVYAYNCTIAGNFCQYLGGGVDLGGGGALVNCILWSNYCSSGTPFSESAQMSLASVTVSNCDIQNLQNGTDGDIAGNPQFVQGLSGQSAPSTNGNFHLTPCSAVIDAGATAQIDLPTDLDGNPRISGSAVDIGAYEFQQPPFLSQPSNITTSTIMAATFAAPSSVTNAAYQWQSRASTNDSFANVSDSSQISGVSSAYLSVTNLNASLSGTQFRCVVVDGCLTVYSSIATLTVTNAAPVAFAQTITNAGDISFVYLDGYDPQGALLTYALVTQPAHGQAIDLGEGLIEYVASNSFFNGTDSFTFDCNNGTLTSAPATITLVIPHQYTMPYMTNQTIPALENTQTPFVLNATNDNGDPATFTLLSSPTNGVLTGVPPHLTYTPRTNFYGSDTFKFQAADGPDTAYAYAYINISHVHQNPVALPDSALVYLRGSVVIPVLVNDYSIETNYLAVVGVTQPAHGSVTFTPTNVTYVENGQVATNDSFTYQISDGGGGVASATVSLTIRTNYNYVVTTNGDSGSGTLREAIRSADSVAGQLFTITFSPTLAGKSVVLTTSDEGAFGPSAFALSNNIILDGHAAPGLILARSEAAAAMRLFRVDGLAQATLQNLILSNGLAVGGAGGSANGGGGGGLGAGGAIYSQGALTLSNITFAANEAQGGQGGTQSGPPGSPGAAGGGVNGGAPGSGAGGFGGGGGSASDNTQGYGGPGGFRAGVGGGDGFGSSPGGALGGAGGFGGGGGGAGGSSFTGGGGLGAGGAIFNNSATLVVTNCVFRGNEAIGGAPGDGPGPNYDGGSGEGLGGGVFNFNGSVALGGCSFVTNNAGNADAVFNIGDSGSASISILQSTFVSYAGGTNFIEFATNSGSASAVRDNASIFTQTAPSIPTIPNQQTIGVASVNVSVLATNPVFSATSENLFLIPNANLALSSSGTNCTLTIAAALGPVGTAQVQLNAAQGPLTMGEIFNVGVSRTLTAEVTPHHGVVIPVLPTNSGWRISSVTQGSNGPAFFTPSSLSYSNNGAAAGDFLAFQVTDGAATTFGSVAISVDTNVIPVAASESLVTEENAPLPIALDGSDQFNDPITYTIATSPTHGVLTGVAPDVTYTPAANFTGSDSFKYYVNNGLRNSTNATVSIFVRGSGSLVVNNAADSGPGTLRAAITQANAAPTTTWRIALAGQTALVSTAGDASFGSSALAISNHIIIDGQGSGSLALASGAPSMRLFLVASNGSLALENLVLQGGIAQGGNGGDGTGGGGGGSGMGGAIFNDGIVALTNVTLTLNQALGGNGGQYNTDGQPDYLIPAGNGGGPNGGVGDFGAGAAGGFGGGGAGGASSANGYGLGGTSGFGAINGGKYPVGPYVVPGGNGGFGGGGGGGWVAGGGGGAGFGGAIFNHGGSVFLTGCDIDSNTVTGGLSYGYYNSPNTQASGLGDAIFNDNGLIVFADDAISGVVYNYGPATNTGILPNIATFGPTNISLTIASGFSNVLVTANNPNFALNLNQGTGILAITPPFLPASANVTVSAESGLIVSNIQFNVALSYDFSNYVAAGQITTMPIFPANSVAGLKSVTQGSNGAVSISGGSLVYTEQAPSATADYFTYIVTNGAQSATGHVTIGIESTTLTVTTALDSGAGSLRAALATAAAQPAFPWRIVFSPSLAAHSVLLTTVGDTTIDAAAFAIGGKITIDASAAPGASIVRSVSASAMRLFTVLPGSSLALNNITVTGWTMNGDAGQTGNSGGGGGLGAGGAIFNGGTLSLSNIVFSNNVVVGGVGGAFSSTTAGGNGGGFNPGQGGVNFGDNGQSGGFGGGGGGAAGASGLGEGAAGGFGAGAGAGNGNADVGGAGGFGGGGGGGNGSGGGGGLGGGGVIFNFMGSLAVNHCVFVSNQSSSGGGGAGYSVNYNGTPGHGYGAGIFNYNGQLSITNTVFSNNVADSGDDLFTVGDGAGSSVTLSNVTLLSASSATNFVTYVINGGSAQQNVAGFNLIGSQSPPWIDPIPNITNNAAFAVPLMISAPALGGAYSVTATSTNTVLVPSGNLQISNGILDVTPAAGHTGSSLITVTVTDTGISASTAFLFTYGVNHPSIPAITNAVQVSRSQFSLQFTGVNYQTYTIEASTNLINWFSLGAAAQTASGAFEFVDTNTLFSTNRFYRIEHTIP